jgi:hypothetical protein
VVVLNLRCGASVRKWQILLQKSFVSLPRLRFNVHLDEEVGLEGIVSKRKDSPYHSGRSPHWIKSKNPTAPAVKREAEEDWGR